MSSRNKGIEEEFEEPKADKIAVEESKYLPAGDKCGVRRLARVVGNPLIFNYHKKYKMYFL